MQTSTVEGQQALLNFFPRNQSPLPTTLYLGIFTSETNPVLTPSTVPANSTQLASPGTAVGEPLIGTGGYARVAVANTVWQAPSPDGQTGYRTTATQQAFPTTTAAWSNPTACGYFIASTATQGSGIAYSYANFDDLTAVAMTAANIVLQLTPYWEWEF